MNWVLNWEATLEAMFPGSKKKYWPERENEKLWLGRKKAEGESVVYELRAKKEKEVRDCEMLSLKE